MPFIAALVVLLCLVAAPSAAALFDDAEPWQQYRPQIIGAALLLVLQAALIGDIATEALETASATWPLLLPEQPMRADHEHRFKSQLAHLGPVSHVRLNLHPDGGVSRLRLFGSIAHT